MNKNIGSLVLISILAIFIGLTIVSRQAKDPLLKEILKQQAELSQSQGKIIQKLDSEQANQLIEMSKKIQMLEQRLAKAEVNIQANAGGARPNFPMPPQEDLSKVYTIPVDHTIVNGKKDAPVTITEFVDFQCPFCARFHPPIMEVLKNNPDKVNVLIKNFPLSFHPQARPAAKAAFAAGLQGKYHEMADELLKNGNSLSDEKFKELAGKIGLNVDQFLKDIKEKDSQWEDLLRKDMALGDQVGVRGTPTIYINGRKTNARDAQSLQAEVDGLLKK